MTDAGGAGDGFGRGYYEGGSWPVDLPRTLEAAARCPAVVAAADQLAACRSDPSCPPAWAEHAAAGLVGACAMVLLGCLTCARIPLTADVLDQAAAAALEHRPG